MSALITQLKPRVQRLGLVDPQTGFYDEDEVIFYVQEAMRSLANCYQLQHFVKFNREFFRTAQGIESYAMPPGYGFWAPQETRRSGFALRDPDDDDAQNTNLQYYDPGRYNLTRSDSEGRPAFFTFAENLMYLQPIPDGVYTIEALERPAQDGAIIPDPYVAAVSIEALLRMASDLGKATPGLFGEHTKVIMTLVNGEKRQAQRFFTSSERLGVGHRGRWR